jgi:hypothetical protein
LEDTPGPEERLDAVDPLRVAGRVPVDVELLAELVVDVVHERLPDVGVDVDDGLGALVHQPFLLGHGVGDRVPAPVEFGRLPPVPPAERQGVPVGVPDHRGPLVPDPLDDPSPPWLNRDPARLLQQGEQLAVAEDVGLLAP